MYCVDDFVLRLTDSLYTTCNNYVFAAFVIVCVACLVYGETLLAIIGKDHFLFRIVIT